LNVSSTPSPGFRLEQYSARHPQEALLVSAQIGEEADQVMIFKGFSSSLSRSTAYDPDVPVLPPDAAIISIDRLVGPYNPARPQYIQQGLSWEAILPLLESSGC
jgi:hypothetical protein